MPNWNRTKYVVTGSKEEISKFNGIINNTLSNKENKSGDFGNDWLGFIVKELNEDPNEISCRGTIENPKLINKTTLKFTTWTAWTSCYELFEMICKKFPTFQYYFISEEPGCDIYETNDKEKKYFKYGKKYVYMSKEAIQMCIESNNILKQQGILLPNNQIYTKIYFLK
jgi:hypothetical protein